MIRASSSGDHLDCFLAGDSAVWAGWRRLAGTVAGILDVSWGTGGTEDKDAGAATGNVGATEGGGIALGG